MYPGGIYRRKGVVAPLLLVALCSISAQFLPICCAESIARTVSASEQQSKDDEDDGGGWLGRGVDRVFAKVVGECLEEDEPSQQHQQQGGQCVVRTDGGVPRLDTEKSNDVVTEEESFSHTRQSLSRLKERLYEPLDARGRFIVGAFLGMLLSRFVAKTLGRLVKTAALCSCILLVFVYLGIWGTMPTARRENVLSLARAATSTFIVSARNLWSATVRHVSLGGVANAAMNETEMVAGLIVGGVAGFVI